MIVLHSQQVICICVEDRLGDLGLATHFVDGHQTARQFQDFKQLRNGGDFVALLVDDDLSQADLVCGSPGADHVNGRLAAGDVKAPTESLAIDGHDLTGRDLVQGGNPTQQARLELGGFDRPTPR